MLYKAKLLNELSTGKRKEVRIIQVTVGWITRSGSCLLVFPFKAI